MASILNPFRRFRHNRLEKKLKAMIQPWLLDKFLETLLRFMQLTFLLDKGYRRNIEKPFRGRYTFQSKDGKIASSAVFRNGRMKVKKKRIDDTDVTVTFENGDVLKKFLFNDDPDVIGALMRQEASFEGNLNYLVKFAYMAKHLQLELGL